MEGNSKEDSFDGTTRFFFVVASAKQEIEEIHLPSHSSVAINSVSS